MALLKRNQTALVDANVFDAATRRRLADHSLTTVEDVLGAIEAEPAAIAALLALHPSDLVSITNRLRGLANRSLLERGAAWRDFPLGALPPPARPR